MTELVRRSGILDLLRRVEEAGALTPVSLSLASRTDLDISTFEAIARFLGRIHDGSKWWVADLLLEAEARFGEAAYQVAEATGRSERTLANWVWVASRVPRSRRREELTFTHHVVVAPLEYPEQRRWLQRAVDEGFSSRELRVAIAAARALEDGDSTAAAADCQELLDQAAASLRERLLSCGYPGDLSLEIKLVAPPVTVVTRAAP
jgi:hypothetical protein